jgi:two-component system, NtrC family, sensor kinase
MTMYKMFGGIKNFLFHEQRDAQASLTIQKHYVRYRRTLLLVMTAVFLTPLLVTSTLSYYHYRSLLQREERDNLHWSTQSAKKTIEAFVDELRSVLVFVAAEYSCEDLLQPEVLNRLFYRLKAKYPGVVDLGVIDSQGFQRAYVGPYDLLGKDYSDRDFFQKLMVRKTYIDSVVTGYRKVPHFSIAVSNTDPGNNRRWIFRINIDAETLSQFLRRIDTPVADDLFLVSLDNKPLLQTPSRFYGKVLESYQMESIPMNTGITITEAKGGSGPPLLMATALLDGTPWVLVLIKKGSIHGVSWAVFRKQLAFIFLFSTAVAMLVILRTTYLMVNRIRQADLRREAILTEMEHTNKLASIGRLAAGVAHEINNPLAIISEKTGLIKDLLEVSGDFKNKEKIAAQIDGACRAVERCKVITHRLLGFARRMDVSLEKIDINGLMLEVWGFLEKEALYRNIRLTLNLQDGLPLLESDRGQLQQIFLNLLNNAIDAIEQEGEVIISTRMEDRHSVRIDITDDGNGMPPEIMNHIFEPFFTTKHTEEKRGTGLGLSITYGLVKKLGGDILVGSKLGAGSTFTVIFPAKFGLPGRAEDV